MPTVSRRQSVLKNAVVWLITGHYFLLLTRNHLEGDWLAGTFVVIAAANGLADTPRTVTAYSVYVMALSVLAGAGAHALPHRRVMLVAGVVTAQSLIALATRRRLEVEGTKASELSAAHELVVDVLNAVPDPIFVMNDDLRYRVVNDAFCRLLARHRGEILGRRADDVFPRAPSTSRPGAPPAREAIATQLVLPGAEGDRVIAAKLAGFRDPSGRRALVGALREITAESRMQHELREAGELFQSSFSHAAIGMALVAPDGRLVKVNRALCDLLGYAEDELLATDVASITEPEDVAREAECTRRILAGEVSSCQLEKRYVHKEGRIVWASLAVSAMRDAAGRPATLVEQMQGIDERRRIETSLVRAKETAEAATRAKSEFLANMSHEVRTPMNGVLGALDLALGTPLTSEQREYLETARRSARGLLRLVDDVLDFSRIEAGKLELDAVAFDLRGALGGMLDALALRARERRIALELDFAPEVPGEVVGDPDRLRQVMLNLVGNALKFTERGGIKVGARAGRRTDGHVMIEFWVQDSGIGIPASHLQSIFEAFTQVDGADTRRYGGTGLGLSIVRQLVSLMGGEIDVESEVGRGTTFRFTARFGLDVESAPRASAWRDSSALLEDPPSLTRVAHVPRDVLLAEDSPVNRLVMTRALERAGHRVHAVEDGRAALDALARRSFDVVLMDVQMPGVDGLEATRALRRRERDGAPRTPVIAITAQAMHGDRERCIGAGMDEYLTKPIDTALLLAAIEATTTGPKAQPPSDGDAPSGLFACAGDDPALLSELVEIFVAETPGSLDDLGRALRDGEGARAAGIAHRLAGGLATVGAEAAAAGARRLEKACAQGELATASAELPELRRAIEHLADDLVALRQTLCPGVASEERAAAPPQPLHERCA